jgi:TRAP-type C4-dicarboxylate transport system permease small subunit
LILREQGHLGFEILPNRWKPILHLITDISVIFFAGALLRPGFRFVAVSLNRESAAIRMPLWILYLAIPVGLILMLVFSVDTLLTNIRALRNPRKEENS